MDLAIGVLHQPDLWQVLERFRLVRGLEQIVASLVVDLEVRHAHLVLRVAALGERGEDV